MTLKDAKAWLADNMNFTTVMIIVVALLSLCGIFLIICILKYPSYDFPENFEKQRKKKEKRKSTAPWFVRQQEDDGENKGGDDSSRDQVPEISDFKVSQSQSSWRLPTPGGALPTGRLPPLVQEQQHNKSSELLVMGMEEDADSADDVAVLDDVKGRVGIVWNTQTVAQDVSDLGGWTSSQGPFAVTKHTKY